MQDSVKKLPVVELKHGWWLDQGYHGGVLKRVGWWITEGKYRTHWYAVVFQDGTRSHEIIGTNPVEEVKKTQS